MNSHQHRMMPSYDSRGMVLHLHIDFFLEYHLSLDASQWQLLCPALFPACSSSPCLALFALHSANSSSCHHSDVSSPVSRMLRLRRTYLSYILLTLLCGLLSVNIWIHVRALGMGSNRAQIVAWARRSTATSEGNEGQAPDAERWAAACDRCMVNTELCGKYGR
jgi:hypothetical protein